MGIFGSPQDQVDLDDLKARVAKLEAAVAVLQAQVAGAVPYGAPMATTQSPGLGGQPTTGAGDWLAEVRALKADGNLIQAIKVYREHTGLGLKESKDAVESLV